MGENMTVSVIIATYMRYKLLLNCLESLARCEKPEYLHYEVIVVDDGGKLPREITADVKNLSVKWLFLDKNIGQPGAQAAGVRESSGQYYAFLDDDAEVDLHWLASIPDYFTNNPGVGAVLGRIEPISTQRLLERTRQQIYDKRDRTYLNSAFIENLKERHSLPVTTETGLSDHVSGGNFAVRREVLEAVGGFRPEIRLGSDTFLSKRLLSGGFAIGYNPAMRIYHHHNPSYKTLFKNSIHEGRDHVRMKMMENIGRSSLFFKAILSLLGSPFAITRFPQMLRADPFIVRAYAVFTMIHLLNAAGQLRQCFVRKEEKGVPHDVP